MIAPSAFVSRAVAQLSRLISIPPKVMLIPPPNVEVPVICEALNTPPVKVSPSEEASPFVPTERPEDVKVEVPVTPDSRSIMPSVSVSPLVDLSPPPPTASPAFVIVEVAVSPSHTKVEVDCHMGRPAVPAMSTVPLVPIASSAIEPAEAP